MKGDLDKLFTGVRAEVTVPESVRDRHLAAIRSQLNAPAAGVSWGVSWFARHRAALAWLTAGMTAMPVAALASQEALPGDVLYPVKRAFEVVAEPLMPRIEAEHRVEELERLAEAGVEEDIISRAVEAAKDAVAETGADDLAVRIEEIIGDDDPLLAPAAEDDGEDDEATTTTSTSTTVTTPVLDDDDPGVSTTTTTVEDSDDHELDSDSDDRSGKKDDSDSDDKDEDDSDGKKDDSKEGSKHGGESESASDDHGS